MKHYLTLLSLLFLYTVHGFSQDTTIVIYFKSGQSKLTPAQQKQVDRLKNKDLVKISFDGYADTVGRSAFNKKLSYKRAAAVAGTIHSGKKELNGNGESKEKKTAMSKMRKVVVKAWYEAKPLVVAEPPKEPVKETSPPKDCTKDTTIFGANGTRITINTCYYEKIKDCFSFKEYYSANAVQEAGLTTQDEKGNPIESGGMFDITFCSDTCISQPVTVFIPVPPCMKGRPMTVWGYTRSGAWRNSSVKVEIVKIDGKEFYKVDVTCPGRINCDRPKPGKPKKYKFKAKDGMKFEEATVSYNCPLTSIKGKITSKGKKAVFPYYCPDEQPVVYIKAKTKTGETVYIKQQQLNNYTRKRKLLSNCACGTKEKESYAGIFKVRKKYLYKKYKFYKEDFPAQSSK